MRRWWTIGLALVIASEASFAADRFPPGQIVNDIVYARTGGRELKLDLIRPPGDGPFPLVVCLHGGGWHIGHRSFHHRTMRRLAENGFVAASAEYRLAPAHKFPEPLHDVKRAIRFLRERAAEYHIDPERVAALGDSTGGGHLALLLGLLDPADGLEPAEESAVSSKVKAVVNYYAPTDFSTFNPKPEIEPMLRQMLGADSNGMLRNFLGTSDKKSNAARLASPIHYVTPGDAAILSFHGEIDPLVPIEQARKLHAALQKAGVPEELVIIPNGNHGWAGRERDRTDRLMIDFLNRTLKMKPPSAPAGT